MSARGRVLLLLFSVALGLRVLYTAVLSAQPDLAVSPVTPDLTYAREIATGFKWLTEPYSPRSPGYPITLAALYLLSAKQLWLMVFYQAVLGALAVVLVYRIGTSFLGSALAALAALWFALHVYHMHLSSVFFRDVLVGLLLLLLLYILLRPLRRMRYAAIGGGVFAALAHVDPQFLLLLPVFAIFVFFKSRHGLLNLQYLFVFLATLIVISLPWTIRNYQVYNQPLPIGLEAQRFLRPAKIVVTEPERGISNLEQKIANASKARIFQKNSREFWRIARFWGENPRKITEGDSTVVRFAQPAWSLRHNLVSILNFGLVFPFFVVGLVFAVLNKNRTGLMLALTVAGYFLIRSYLGGDERVRVPVDPLIILIAFYGVMALIRLRFPKKTPSDPSI